MRVLVDFDGTLVDGSADKAFNEKRAEVGKEKAVEWYAHNCPDDLALNEAVLARLFVYKAMGYTMVLWTNRGNRQISATLRNLGKYNLHKFFDMMIFGDGSKLDAFDEKAIIFDNEWVNLEGSSEPNFIPTFI